MESRPRAWPLDIGPRSLTWKTRSRNWDRRLRYSPYPIVVSGSTEAERAAATLVATQEMMKTIAEGLARAKANSEALSHLAAQEQAALKAANRQRLEALRAQYEQEYAAIEARRNANAIHLRIRIKNVSEKLYPEAA